MRSNYTLWVTSYRFLFFVLICNLQFATYNCFSQNADINLLRKINSNNMVAWDNTNKFITQSMTPVSLATPVGFFIYGLLAHDSASKRNSYMMGASLAASGIITVGLKYSIHRPRPFVTYTDIIKKSRAGSFSFPSGHTSSAFATATSLSLLYPKWYVIGPSFLWASAVGYSRMELGVHYPSDVLVGALIGIGSSFLMYKVNNKMAEKK